jgi:hypothetical protein
MNDKLIRSWLADKSGRGRKPTITPEQKAMILAVACEPPSQSGYPNTHWTNRLLTAEVIQRGIVDDIAFQTVWSFLKGSRSAATPKHCSWLNQIENWFSGLSRRVLAHGNFRSVDELKTKILNYIEFYNKNAKPMKWKYDAMNQNKNKIIKAI